MGMSLRKKAYLSVLLAVVITPNVWAAVTEDDLALVEEEINTIKDARDTATKLSGYVDAEYIDDSRDAATIDDKYGFRLHHLSLFITKRFNQDWKFFSEVEFEDGLFMDTGSLEGETFSNTSGSIFNEAVNIDYQWSPSQYVRIGRDFTPAGIWSVDHYPPFVPTQETPMHIRMIFPGVVDGVNAHGTVSMGSTFMDYDVYVANGADTPGQSDNNDRKAVGGRVSFILPMFNRFELGASVFRDTSTETTDTTHDVDISSLPGGAAGDVVTIVDGQTSMDVRKTAYGLHAKVKEGRVTLQTEYASDTMKPLGGGAETKQLGYYLQALYDIQQWTLGYRYDFWDADKSDANKVTDNAVFVNYHVNPNIVCKLETHMVSNKDSSVEDYQRTVLSIAYYLGN